MTQQERPSNNSTRRGRLGLALIDLDTQKLIDIYECMHYQISNNIEHLVSIFDRPGDVPRTICHGRNLTARIKPIER